LKVSGASPHADCPALISKRWIRRALGASSLIACALLCSGCLDGGHALIDDDTADYPFGRIALIQVYKMDSSAQQLAPFERRVIVRKSATYVLKGSDALRPNDVRVRMVSENHYAVESSRGIGVLSLRPNDWWLVYEDFGGDDCRHLSAELALRFAVEIHGGTCTVPTFEGLRALLRVTDWSKHRPQMIFRVVQSNDDPTATFDLCLPRRAVERRIREIAAEEHDVKIADIAAGKTFDELGINGMERTAIRFAVENWYSTSFPEETTRDSSNGLASVEAMADQLLRACETTTDRWNSSAGDDRR
jgi:acyl carrier protein